MIQEKNEKVKTIIMAMAIFLFVMIAVPVHAAWNVWLDHAVKKYRQGGEDGTNGLSSLTIKAAKNEFESFQVLESVVANCQELGILVDTYQQLVNELDLFLEIAFGSVVLLVSSDLLEISKKFRSGLDFH